MRRTKDQLWRIPKDNKSSNRRNKWNKGDRCHIIEKPTSKEAGAQATHTVQQLPYSRQCIKHSWSETNGTTYGSVETLLERERYALNVKGLNCCSTSSWNEKDRLWTDMEESEGNMATWTTDLAKHLNRHNTGCWLHLDSGEQKGEMAPTCY